MSQCLTYCESAEPGFGQREEAILVPAATKLLHPEQDDNTKEDLLQTLLNDPFDPVAHSRLGALYWRQGHVEDALCSLTRALEIDSKNREAIVICSEVFRALGRAKDAKEMLSAYLASHPGDIEIQSLLEDPAAKTFAHTEVPAADFLNEQGEAQFALGRLDRARACFEMATEAHAGHWTAHCNLGVLSWEEGKVHEALSHFYTAMDLNPHDPEVLQNCFSALRAAGHLEAAASVMQLYLQQGFGNDDTWEDFTRLNREIGASSWTPGGLTREAASIYLAMGNALFDAGDQVGAFTAFERAIKIAPESAEVYYQAGRVIRETGEANTALEFVRKALELLPSHQGAALMETEITEGQMNSGAEDD